MGDGRVRSDVEGGGWGRRITDETDAWCGKGVGGVMGVFTALAIGGAPAMACACDDVVAFKGSQLKVRT